MAATPPQVGAQAPDLVLPDTHGTPVELRALRGAPVLLVFVPFAFSATCSDELAALRGLAPLLAEKDVRLLVVATDTVFALRAWARHEGYELTLLSDFWPHGAVAKEYGVFDEADGMALRGSFLLDAQGVVRWSVVNPRGAARDVEDYRAAIEALAA